MRGHFELVLAGHPFEQTANLQLTEPAQNRVVVGGRDALARRDIRARGRIFCSVARADAKLRYRSPAVPSGVETHAGGARPRWRPRTGASCCLSST